MRYTDYDWSFMEENIEDMTNVILAIQNNYWFIANDTSGEHFIRWRKTRVAPYCGYG